MFRKEENPVDENKNNNPFDSKDFYIINKDLYFDEEENPEVFNGDNPDFSETEISFVKEYNTPKPQPSAPKTYSLGPINTEVQQENKKKKFVVTFDDSEDIVPPSDPSAASPMSRGGIYFTNGIPDLSRTQYNNQNNYQRPAPQQQQVSRPAPVQQQQQRRQPAANAQPVRQTAPVKQKQNAQQNKNQAAQGAKKKKKKPPVTGAKFAFRFLSAVLAFTLFFSYLGVSCLNDVLAITRKDEDVSVTIPNGATVDQVIDILDDNDLIHQKWFCKFFFNLKNKLFNEDPGEIKFMSGVYTVKKNMGFEAYLNEFQEVQETAKTVKVFFQEGWTIYQMFDKLDKFEICKKEQLIASLKGTDFDFDFIKDLPNDTNRVFKLDGYLFPDTYEFYEKTDANTIIRRMLENFRSKWTEEYSKRAAELGYTMDEIIIIASIIQREAGNAEQMPLVSSVIHNRLNHSVSYPTLGCDATSNYIEKYVKPNVTSAQAQTYLSYYDTSSIKGLPAGPICNPGIDAIEAALYPEQTNYYYFCHDNSGQIYLAETNAEHDRNLLEVLRKNSG